MTSLRQRMLEDMVRWLSPSTQQRYVQAVARFARHFGRSPAHLGPEQIRAYQVYLTTDRRLAASSLAVAVSAIRFLYRVTLKKDWTLDDVIPRAKRPRSLPVVPSQEEAAQFLNAHRAPIEPSRGCRDWPGTPATASRTSRARGRSCPPSRWGCSPRCGSRSPAAAGRGGARWPASAAWCWRRRCWGCRWTSSPTTTASTPTWACSAAGRWRCPRRRLGGCSFFPRPARPLPRRPRRARCRKPADTSREHPQGKRRTRAGCHRPASPPGRRRARRRRRPASSSAATPIFIRAAGYATSRASRSISAHVAARASPDRQAVSITNRRHALTATAADESVIVSRAAPTSWYGRARKCALTAGSDVRGGRNPLRLLYFLGISGNRREEGVAPQSRAMMRQTATSIPSSASRLVTTADVDWSPVLPSWRSGHLCWRPGGPACR